MTKRNTRRGFTQNGVICPPCGEQSLAPEGFNPGVAQAAKEGQNRKNALWSLLPRVAVLPPQEREMFHGFTQSCHPEFISGSSRYNNKMLKQVQHDGIKGFTLTPQGRYAGYSGRIGFTLIELLVVVLIIGILAAIAMPQYNKAVNKAKATEALNAIDALDKSLTAYYLEHGSYGNSEANGPVTADELPIKVPALKYFHYNDGSGEFQFGSSGSTPQYQNFYNVDLTYVQNIGTGGLWISASWEDGKQRRKACSSTLATEHPQCADFFPQCAAATKNLQLGCKDWSSFCPL